MANDSALDGVEESAIIANAKKEAENIKFSLIVHLALGLATLLLVFFTSAFVNKLPITPKTLAPPILVGLVAGFLIWKSRVKIINTNLKLEQIIEKRTLDLQVANNMLEDNLKSKKMSKNK